MKNYVLKNGVIWLLNLFQSGPKKVPGQEQGETLKHVQYASNQEYGSIKCIAERINLLWTYIQQNFSDSAIVQQGDQKWA